WARVIDHRPGAVAVRARLRDREDALALGLHAPAVADRADPRRGAGLGSGPATGRTRLGGRHGERHLRAFHRLIEGQRDLRLEIAAARLSAPAPAGAPAGPRASTEQVGQDVAEATAE